MYLLQTDYKTLIHKQRCVINKIKKILKPRTCAIVSKAIKVSVLRQRPGQRQYEGTGKDVQKDGLYFFFENYKHMGSVLIKQLGFYSAVRIHTHTMVFAQQTFPKELTPCGRKTSHYCITRRHIVAECLCIEEWRCVQVCELEQQRSRQLNAC